MEQIKFKTNDEELFTVDKDIIFRSTVVKNMYDDLDTSDDITLPLSTINGPTFKKIIEYCTYHKDDPPFDEEANEKDRNSDNLLDWDREFTNIPVEELEELTKAANFLDIKSLLVVCCKTYANNLKDKTVEEIRKYLGVTNDFEPGEEEEARKKLLDVSLNNNEQADEENQLESTD